MQPIEALADAIMQFEGWRGPNPKEPNGTHSWRTRNPGNLRPVPGTTPSFPVVDGYYDFSTLAMGFSRLVADLDAKFGGSHNLTPQSTMLDLFNVYAPAGDANNPSEYTQFVCGWTSKALGRTIRPTTTLEEFLGT